MRTISCLVAILACMTLFSAPVAAMTSESLDITITHDGNADIHFTYRLNWIEYISVYLRMVDPAQELKKALESNFHKPVTVIGVNSGSVHLSVDSFASVTERDGKTTVRTPGLSFAEGERILRTYWFAPLISVDLSPSVTTIRFPDGSVATFIDALEIPPQVRSW
ncbi:MAG TPA: hypothetical protein PK069_04205 [Methanolinea sp.]|nr:hypothetical protein [Methanolinea sp.]HQK55699.1 hypothetical protein [Methanolinea sp.]